MIFSREWDYLCPRYLGVVFHPSGTICAQNVRFYTEATLSMHGKIILPVCSIVCFSLHIFSFDLFFFACCRFSPKWDHLCPRYLEIIFSPKWDHLCPRYLEMIFFTRMGPSVPRYLFIYCGVMFHRSGTICAQNVRFYTEETLSMHGKIIMPVCCFPPFP